MKRRLLITIGIIVGIILAIILTVWLLGRFARAPASGSITHTYSNEDQSEQALSTKDLSGQYFKLTYPDRYANVQNITTGDRNALEVYRMSDANDLAAGTIVLTIKPLPTGGMDEESSYKLREQRPDTYDFTEIDEIQSGAVMVENAETNETVIFLSAGGKLAIIAVTTNGNAIDSEELASQLARDFKWNN